MLHPPVPEVRWGLVRYVSAISDTWAKLWDRRHANYTAALHAELDALIAALQSAFSPTSEPSLKTLHGWSMQWRRRGLS